jgi:hypothetical protein
MVMPSTSFNVQILLFVPIAMLLWHHAGSASAADEGTGQRYIELMQYEVASAERQAFLLKYLRDSAVPALNRAGIEPVGVFTVKPAEPAEDGGAESVEDFSVYVLTQFDSFDDFESLGRKVAADDQFLATSREYFNTPKDNPAYVRKHTKLMKAFAGFPAIAKPADGPRYFELRTYEAHNELEAGLKVAMFNEGEIDVFKKVGMRPVFFGQTYIGQGMPHLTYMLAYADKAEEQRVWDDFRNNPDWHALRDNPRYADTVSTIHRVFLMPADFSQL